MGTDKFLATRQGASSLSIGKEYKEQNIERRILDHLETGVAENVLQNTESVLQFMTRVSPSFPGCELQKQLNITRARLHDLGIRTSGEIFQQDLGTSEQVNRETTQLLSDGELCDQLNIARARLHEIGIRTSAEIFQEGLRRSEQAESTTQAS